MTTKSEREGLFRAVIEEPDDDRVRLVLADWLEEHGEGDRAEFIRLQIRRVTLDRFDPEVENLDGRIHQLLCQHEATWKAELPVLEQISLGTFERGLVAWARPRKLAALARQADTVFTAAPINSLSIMADDEDDRPTCGSILSNCGYAHRIQRLRFEGMASRRDLDLPGMAANLPGLRELDLSEGAHEDGILVELGKCRGWPRLEKLRMHRGYFTLPGMQALASSPLLATLRDIDLSRSSVGHNGFVTLLSSPHLVSLRRLNMNEDNLGTASVRALLERPWPELEDLDLSYNELGPVAGRLLAETEHLPRLRDLNLAGNNLGDQGLTALARSDRLAALRCLHLGSGDYGSKGLKALARASWLPNLVELDLFGFEGGVEGVKILAKAPLTGLRKLNLGYSKLGDEGIRALVKAVWLSNLKDLDLYSNQLGAEGAATLAEAPGLDGLRRLNLSENKIPAPEGDRLRERFGDRVTLRNCYT